MIVSQYIKNHPKSILAQRLKQKFGVNSRKEIHIGSGLLAPNTPQSNIYKLMESTKCYHYIVGGRAEKNANDGSYFAIYK
jgi:hypothetical protein